MLAWRRDDGWNAGDVTLRGTSSNTLAHLRPSRSVDEKAVKAMVLPLRAARSCTTGGGSARTLYMNCHRMCGDS